MSHAGTLNRKVRFLRPSEKDDGTGTLVDTETLIRTQYAKIEVRTGRDSEENERRENVQRIFVTVRNYNELRVSDILEIVDTGERANLVTPYGNPRDVYARWGAEKGVI